MATENHLSKLNTKSYGHKLQRRKSDGRVVDDVFKVKYSSRKCPNVKHTQMLLIESIKG